MNLPLDIARCANAECLIRHTCQRHLNYIEHIGSAREVWCARFEPDENGHCASWIPVKECPHPPEAIVRGHHVDQPDWCADCNTDL